MRGENRRDLYRYGTAAVAVTTALLVIHHFTTRERTVREARSEVSRMHEEARNLAAREIGVLKARLEEWNPGQPHPRDFDKDRVIEVVNRPPVGFRPMGDGPGRYWVHTFFQDTDSVQEGDAVLPLPEEKEYGVALSFQGQGKGTLEVRASMAEEAGPETPPVELWVLLRKGPFPPEPLTKKPLVVKPGSESPGSYPLEIDESIRRLRHDLVFRVPADAPPVRVTWQAHIGDPQRREVAIAVPKTLPARMEDHAVKVKQGDAWVEVPGKILRPEERVFFLGSVPLDHFAAKIREEAILHTPEWGDRLYLTDVSGTVADAVPDYPEKIRRRVKLEGRTSLASVATQRIKIRSGAVDEYEGFAGDRVIGAFGPLDPINGGLLVEREEKRVLEAWRGLQAWHLAAVIFGLLLLYPAVPPVVRRIREDTELPRLLSYAREFMPHIGGILVAATLYAVGTGVFAYQVKVVFDEVILSRETTAYDRLAAICWLLAWVSVCMFAVNWVKEYLGKVIQVRLVMKIRCILCDKIAHLPMAFHSRQRAGDLLSRIQSDVAETGRSLEMLFGDVISDPILIVVLTSSAFVINWRLALVVFVGLPVILLPISYFGKAIKKYSRRRQAKHADVTHTINQMLVGIRVVKAFRMEDHEAKRVREVSANYLLEALRVARAQVTSKEFLELFSNLSVALVLGLGGYLVLERQVSIGDLSALAAVIARMYRSSKSLTTNYNKMQESLAGTERIFEIIDTPDTMADRATARALVRPRSEIAFEGVSFRYSEDGPWVLRNVSFRVPVGASVALVGSTGAGKSTLLDLVARFYDPQEGRVSMDGVDLRDFSRDSLLAQVAVVTQEPFLFNATIAENLRYGRPGAAQTEIEAAARAAFIHDEILKQEQGYETVVGERGARLSGGQRQRVTIARAILKDPPILLLDEATSALDSRAEQRVQEALANLMRDRTTFVIAHRLSTIRGVDKILVLEGGTIVEEGTHADLMAIPQGHYRRLHDIQFAAAPRTGPDAAAAG